MSIGNKTLKNRNHGEIMATEEHEQILRDYATKIKNRVFIDIAIMEKELNKIKSPLKHAISFDDNLPNKYTLNEYALMSIHLRCCANPLAVGMPL